MLNGGLNYETNTYEIFPTTQLKHDTCAEHETHLCVPGQIVNVAMYMSIALWHREERQLGAF